MYQRCIGLLSLLIFLTILPGLSLAQNQCAQIFSHTELMARDQKLDLVIQAKRAKSLRKAKISEFHIRGLDYKVLGLLGESSSTVYLALSPKGQRVVIKHIKETDEINLDWIHSIYYEMAVTEYYLSQGLLVPKILDYEVIKKNDVLQEGFLVKEYREGLTREEFLEHGGLDFLIQDSRYRTMNESYEKDERKTYIVHAGFRDWLDDNKIDLKQHPFSHLNTLIKHGDHSGYGYRNWLFDIETYQWVLFDP